jgi:hypothetical protein
VTPVTALGVDKRDRKSSRDAAFSGGGLSAEAKATRAREGVMLRILVLLVAVTVGCGVAAGVTVAHAPAHAVQLERGY